ncbi:hypothetical protein COM39_15450 [Bacillus toyonensis]|nr:hypothetical protein COM39_15450 [Bacillus toyonensis]
MSQIILLGVCVYILLTYAIYMKIKDFYFEEKQPSLLVVLTVGLLPVSVVITYWIVKLFDNITI